MLCFRRKPFGALTRDDAIVVRRRDPVSARQLLRYIELEAMFGGLDSGASSEDDNDDGGDWDRVLKESVW